MEHTNAGGERPSQTFEVATGSVVLVVDDQAEVRRAYRRVLQLEGYSVLEADDGDMALKVFEHGDVDAIVSDVAMPGLDGIGLLRAVRTIDKDVPVLLTTGYPGIDSAVDAVTHGATRYLQKPVGSEELLGALRNAVQDGRAASQRRAVAEAASRREHELAALERTFDACLERLRMAYQPILDARTRQIYGYEALVRSGLPEMANAGAIVSASETLSQTTRLGRAVRREVADNARFAPPGATLFVNLHAHDLGDDSLLSAPLKDISRRVVLEVTEQANLGTVPDFQERVRQLRMAGYRIAVDDLGAGYASLSAMAQLEPEVVKLDMTLVRDIHTSATKQRLVRSISSLAQELGALVVAEGIETIEERDVLCALGCDLLQGYLFAKPTFGFAEDVRMDAA